MVSSREDELRKTITDCGAVLHGHFRLASGRHSDTYIEKFRVLERPQVLKEVAGEIAEHFRAQKPDIVAGPSTGGMIVAYEVARQLGIPALYVETQDGKRIIKRNAQVEAGTRVLVVDDVLTTGISLLETLETIRSAGGEVLGVGVLIDRSGAHVDFGAEFFASCRFEATSYPEDEIPDWLAAIPLTTPGTRASITG